MLDAEVGGRSRKGRELHVRAEFRVKTPRAQGCGRLTARGARHLCTWPRLERVSLSGCPLAPARDVLAALAPSPTLLQVSFEQRLYQRQRQAAGDSAAAWVEVTGSSSGRAPAVQQAVAVPPARGGTRRKQPQGAARSVPTSGVSPPVGRSPGGTGASAWRGAAATSKGGDGWGKDAAGDSAPSTSFPPPPGRAALVDKGRGRVAGPDAADRTVEVDERLRYSAEELLRWRTWGGGGHSAAAAGGQHEHQAEEEWRHVLRELELLCSP